MFRALLWESILELEYLASCEEALPILATWYYREWGFTVPGNSLEKEQEKLRGFLNIDKIPLIILAKVDGEVAGAAQLKFREMDIYPDREHWLGAVYVDSKFRGQSLAKEIIGEVVKNAERLGVRRLYLQTEHLDGGLYKSLGWRPLNEVTYHGVQVLVMEHELGTARIA